MASLLLGGDLKERATMTHEDVAMFQHSARGMLSSLETMPMTVIAAIDGYALGGGLELALACDIRVAGLAFLVSYGNIVNKSGLSHPLAV
jgi:methylglutaconyl-CoA hydratase